MRNGWAMFSFSVENWVAEKPKLLMGWKLPNIGPIDTRATDHYNRHK